MFHSQDGNTLEYQINIYKTFRKLLKPSEYFLWLIINFVNDNPGLEIIAELHKLIKCVHINS